MANELGWREKARREDFVVRVHGKLYRVYRWSVAADHVSGAFPFPLNVLVGLFQWANRSKNNVKSTDWYVEIVDCALRQGSLHKETVSSRKEAEALVLRYVEAMERGNLEPWMPMSALVPK